ncbi:PREDICTED: teneurin-3-like [Lipotes vexillifer]|uniref:Teneurin-3-like n=1 Tax=Lipotes vexillifer TaxID=118797 RepID=A0A340Y7G1_LIPVE|nr:PREDICTED: teneurin-3-like [Lipotes vexillifer]
MDVKERRPYCSLTKNRREKERRYTNPSADSAECRVPTQKSYSSSETLKAFDHDSSRLLYGNRVKDLVHREADEFTRQGQNFTLRQLGVCEPEARRGLACCAEMGLPHRGYSISAGSDADTENEAVMSPEHAMRLWGRGVKSGRSSCLSSRSNSALTLTDTEHENKSDSENDRLLLSHPELKVPTFPPLPGYSASCTAGPRDVEVFVLLHLPVSTPSSAPWEPMTFDTRQTKRSWLSSSTSS